jgi:REP element-mobilizing transposase RayT
MADRFQNRFRIPSTRLAGWDYGQEAMYFVTVCTEGRKHTLGEIRNGLMCLSDIGACVYNNWLETPILRPDMNLQLGEFVVMPNHFHGILIIGGNDYNATPSPTSSDLTGIRPPQTSIYKNKFAPQSKNLASVMRGFKSSVTSFANDNHIPFGWQERYYDHIIRSFDEYLRISRYVITNIENWRDDCFYS